jgi:hypothetical protein
LIILIILGEECKLWSSSFCSLLQSPATSSLLRANEIAYLHPYKITRTIIVFLNILVFRFATGYEKTKDSELNGSKHSLS